MRDVLIILGSGLVFLAVIIPLICIPAVLFMLAWNYVAAGVFGAPVLAFWQAWVGLFLLAMVAAPFKRRVVYVREEKSR